MIPRVLLIVVLAALAGGLAGFGLGRMQRSTRIAPVGATPVPAADDTELQAVLAENRELRAALAEERRALVEPPPPGHPAVAAPDEVAAPPIEEKRTPEQLLRDIESIEYELGADPTNADLLSRYVETSSRAGEIDRAIARLEALATEHPDAPDVHDQLGRAYVAKIPTLTVPMEQGNFAFKAIARFDHALEVDPDHLSARVNRGVTNHHMPAFLNRQEAAITDLEKAVAQGGGRGDDDRYAPAYAWLVRAYRKAERTEDAEKTLADGLRLFPADPALLRTKEKR